MRTKLFKKWVFGLLLSFCLTLFGAFALVSCREKDGLKVRDWENASVTVKLGDYYEIPAYVALSETGERYDVSVCVTQRRDQIEIPLVNNAFDIMDIKGYKIVYTAQNGRKTAKKTLTVNVEDKGVPVILCKSSQIAEVNQKYTWTDIQVTDASDTATGYSVDVYYGEEKVESDQSGFTPSKVGEYELRITAKDESGNVGALNYVVFARQESKRNEIDGFDDAGLEYVAYTKQNNRKVAAKYSRFTRLRESGGSAVIYSTAEETTPFYITPRIKDASALSADGYIAVWVYIADPLVAEREIIFLTSSQTIPTNEWTEVRLTTARVGEFDSFIGKLTDGSSALLTIKNHTAGYAVIVDDAYFINSAPTVTGLKENYKIGESVNFSSTGNVVADCAFAGQVDAVSSGYIPDCAGTYTVSIYDESRKNGVFAHTFTVGACAASLDPTAWFDKEGNKLPVVTENDAISEGWKFYAINLLTCEKQQIADGFRAPSEFFFVQAEKENAFLWQAYERHAQAAGVWCSFDDPSVVVGTLDSTYYSEFMGEKGVISFYSNSKERNFRPAFRATYLKEHYAQFEYLKIRAMSNQKFSMAFVVESSWRSISFNDFKGQHIYQWTDYYIPMSGVLKLFDGLNSNELIVNVYSESADVEVWISEIAAFNRPQAKARTWWDTDSPIGAEYDKVTWLSEKDGQTGVLAMNITTQKTEQTVEHKTLSPAFDKAYYENYDTIVFRMKSEVSCTLQLGFDGTKETPWKFERFGTLTNEWQNFEIPIDMFLTYFDVLADTQCFIVQDIEAHDGAFNIYIADVSVRRDGDSLINTDENGNLEAGNSWMGSWN